MNDHLRLPVRVLPAVFALMLALLPAVKATATEGGFEPFDPARLMTFSGAAQADSSATAGVESQIVKDGGFEAGFPNANWADVSSVATNICSVALCGDGGGTALPRSGDWWAWFGGTLGPESATLTQSIYIPRGDATLSFYLWMGLITSTGSFTADIDGNIVFTATVADFGVYGSGYQLVEVDVSAYADSKTHALRFTGQHETLLNNISLDDVKLVVDQVFIDDNGHTFEADIEWLAEQGITRGCNPPANDRFCPDDSVTRGQMAAFLHRALDGIVEPTGDPIDFTDDDDSTFVNDIAWLSATGITKGCTATEYCPDKLVTRGQMAAFLVRALGYTDDGGGDLFTDDDDSIFESDIDKLATAGVTRGCNPPLNDRFCPGSNVTRGQMAAFLHRALG